MHYQLHILWFPTRLNSRPNEKQISDMWSFKISPVCPASIWPRREIDHTQVGGLSRVNPFLRRLPTHIPAQMPPALPGGWGKVIKISPVNLLPRVLKDRRRRLKEVKAGKGGRNGMERGHPWGWRGQSRSWNLRTLCFIHTELSAMGDKLWFPRAAIPKLSD